MIESVIASMKLLRTIEKKHTSKL